MSHLPWPNEKEQSPLGKEMIDKFQKKYGRPTHIFPPMSWNDRFISASSDAWHRLVVEPSIFPRWVKEAIVVITCSTQGTEYCVQGHSHALRRESNLSEKQVKAIQSHTFEGFSDPELSIFRFAHKAAGKPKSMTRQDYETLQKLGLTNEMILEILGVIWVNTAMNFIVDALGVKRTSEELRELELT
jgi:uncharacterized peroxidase-related enzyme